MYKMQGKKWTRKHTLVVLSMFIIIGLKINFPIDDNNNHRNLGFPGYGGRARIPPVNLTSLKEQAESVGLETQVWLESDYETFRDPAFLGLGVFNLEYHPDDNRNSYHLRYTTIVPVTFWEKLGYYLNLTESEILEEIRYFNETSTERDNVLGRKMDGKPNWDRIIQDQEILVTNRTSEIGQIHLEFNRQIKIRLNTDYVRIEKRTEYNGTEINLWILIDTDSDLEITLECGKPLTNPEKIASIFTEELGLPSLKEMGLVLYERVYI